MLNPPVIILAGPTAVGKTELSLELAEQLSGEIISGDSMQIYRGLDIGTAKVSLAEQRRVRHHLIDICDPGDRFTVYDFQQHVKRLITEITQRQHVPIIVGGTGFYLSAVVNNLPLGGHDDPQTSLRATYQQLLAQKGSQFLWEELAKRDAQAAQAIPVANSRRIIRALEVIEHTGAKFSQQVHQQPFAKFKIIALTTSRPNLYNRINQRVDMMMTQGLEEEAACLFQQVDAQAQAAKGIGYREFWPYFDHQQTLTRTIELIKQDSRHFAKRQLTYFRHQLPVQWENILEQPERKKSLIQELYDWSQKNQI